MLIAYNLQLKSRTVLFFNLGEKKYIHKNGCILTDFIGNGLVSDRETNDNSAASLKLIAQVDK